MILILNLLMLTMINAFFFFANFFFPHSKSVYGGFLFIFYFPFFLVVGYPRTSVLVLH